KPTMILSLAFGPDGKRLAAAMADGTIQVWDIEKGAELLTIRAHGHTCCCLAFSPDGRLLGSGGGDSVVRILDSTTGQEVCSFRGHEDSVVRVTFQYRGERLALVNIGGVLRISDATSDQNSRTLYRVPPGGLWGISMEVSPDARFFIVHHKDGTLKVYDCATGEQRFTLRTSTEVPFRIDFCPCGRFLATASRGGIKLWKVDTHRELFSLGEAGGKPWGGYRLAFSQDGRQFAAVQWGGPIHLWDTENGQRLLTIDVGSDGICGLAFSPDGARLFSIGDEREVKVWDTANGR